MVGGVAAAAAATLAAAACFAVANTLQHHGASQLPRAGHPALLLRRLLVRPVWLAGIAADGFGMALHVLALSMAALAIVQPLSVCVLMFALPLSRLTSGRRIRTAEYAWTALVAAGLAVFLAAARPTAGDRLAAGPLLADGTGAAAGLIVLLVAAARRRGCRHRAVFLGLATGIVFGLVSALTKQLTGLVTLGLSALLASWSTYALLAAGAAALLLAQYAYRAGPLSASLPAMTIADPIVATALGVVAFGETFAAGTGAMIIAAAGFLALTVGVVGLARTSPITTGDFDAHDRGVRRPGQHADRRLVPVSPWPGPGGAETGQPLAADAARRPPCRLPDAW